MKKKSHFVRASTERREDNIMERLIIVHANIITREDDVDEKFLLCKAKHVNNVWDCKIINHWELLSWKSLRF